MHKRFGVLGLLLLALLVVGLPGAGAQAPISSDNVHLLTTIPDVAAISGEFALTGDFFYVSSLKGVTAYDTSNPEQPQPLGVFADAFFENESMTYGERVVDGELRRFVVLGIDLVSVPVTDPEHAHLGFDRLHILDVTDPMNMFIAGDLETTTSTHTVQCVSQADCRYAYTAGTDGFFEVLDFSDIDNPKIAKKVASPAAGPNAVFASGAGHYWDFDTADVGWHTGSGGAAAFDVSDPANPRPIQATNAKSLDTPYNDFILHNSKRPNAEKFQPGAAPDVDKGNVLLVTEEDYFNDGNEVQCTQETGSEAGTFQTWYIPHLDGQKYRAGNRKGEPGQGTIKPLDIVNAPAEFGDNAPLSTPAGAFCSGHWFDYHPDGIVAQGYYQQGLWFEDVSNPNEIAYYGHYTPVAAEVWDAYWVPKRGKDGKPTGLTNLVYTADAVRGIDVLRVDLPSTGGGAAPDVGEDDSEGDGGSGSGEAGAGGTGGTGPVLPATGGGTTLLLIGAAGLLAAAGITRRRR